MDEDKKRAISADLVNASGIKNFLVPIIVESAAKADSVEAFKASLVGLRGLPPALIPRVIEIVIKADPTKMAAKETVSEEPTEAEAAEVDETENEEPEEDTAPEKSREDLIYDAVAKIIEGGVKDNLTSNGSPRVEVLEEMLGFNISASERTTAFEQYQENN